MNVLWDELIEAWEIDLRWIEFINEREGRTCQNCGCSARAQHMAKTIINYCAKSEFIRENVFSKLCENAAFQKMDIAEINGCSSLHKWLSKVPNLNYSEYGSIDPKIRSENLMNLSYNSNSFDLVLTSDTLEHLPEIQTGLEEIHRVLKPGGAHIFTVPVIWNRDTTRKRAEMKEGDIHHILSPSYHGAGKSVRKDRLVFYEFGSDIIKILEEAGFEISVFKDRKNPSISTFISIKKSY